jgi:heptaprenyl diphosphate synthase
MNSYRIPEIAKQYTEYDMIQKHTNLPEFPEFRTRLLYAFLNKNDALQTFSELFTLVTSLVQLGLDTHDMVTESNDVKEKKAARTRQLQVLAGDYFSSRFYNLLSQAGQIELIRLLSGAICEVNRLKMNFYMMMKQLKVSAEDYIQQTVAIRSQLFLSFAAMMEDIYHAVWPDILSSFTRCEVIFEEIFRAESAQNFRGSWGFWHILQNGSKDDRKQLQADEPDQAKLRTLLLKHNVSAQLYQLLEGAILQLQAKVRQLDSEKLVSELFQICEPFTRFLTKLKALEEI